MASGNTRAFGMQGWRWLLIDAHAISNEKPMTTNCTLKGVVCNNDWHVLTKNQNMDISSGHADTILRTFIWNQ